MRVIPVPCLRDNYAYLVVCDATQQAAVVDPAEAGPVAAAIAAHKVELVAIWNTHHHWDHTGGNKELQAAHTDLAIVAHSSDRGRVPGQTVFAEEGDVVSIGDEVRATIIHNPGHTLGAISFYMSESKAVFTGDTLFAGGCGRLFEGSPAMMHESMTKLAALPNSTSVYFGHEYTAANLRFAAQVEPNNEQLAARRTRTDAQLATDNSTVPSTIAEEIATNPFMRSAEPAVLAAAKANEPPSDDSAIEVLAAIRRWKDRS